MSGANLTMDFMDLDAARVELVKLQRELLAAEMNVQESAHQGLILLHAKSELVEQNELLEEQLEKLRVERDRLNEVHQLLGLIWLEK